MFVSLAKEYFEQKPVEWSEKDENAFNDAVYFLERTNTYSMEHEEHSRLISCRNWLKSLKDRVIPQPKQEWSEEDEKMLNNCINAIHAADYYDLDDKNRMEHWLKSLTDRVLPQQHEWNEEDEKMIDCIITDYEGEIQHLSNSDIDTQAAVVYKERITWLKSLRPQKRWKPSKEQIDDLGRAISSAVYGTSVLRELYEQLKQL